MTTPAWLRALARRFCGHTAAEIVALEQRMTLAEKRFRKSSRRIERVEKKTRYEPGVPGRKP